MNSLYKPRKRGIRNFQILFASAFIIFTIGVSAQQPELTLADILIGLRSKKVTLDER
ncbi:MAG: hypothetical protein IT174_02835, partial [Acidobacteria bacterium]|nr:hypothetical protein [Acidobacteriota bacterium]